MGEERQSGGARWTGGRRRHTDLEIAGLREGSALAASLGRDLRSGRRARRLTQRQVAERIGVSHARYGDLERGHGAGSPLGLWIAACLAVGRPLSVAISRAAVPEPADSGHLAAQELILRLAAARGRPRSFELPTRRADGSGWVDVGLRDDARRVLSVVEVGNRVDDLGMARRAFKRRLADAELLAAAAGGEDGPYRVAGCWVLTDTAANRAIVRRYPAIIAADFPGSSRGWVEALEQGLEPPAGPGLVWADTRAGEIRECRMRRA